MTVQNSKETGSIWRVTDEMQINTVAALEPKGRQVIDNASGQLTIDLSEVTRSDSTGVALLIAWLRYARKKQKTILFLNLPQKMQNNIRLSDLESVLLVDRHHSLNLSA